MWSGDHAHRLAFTGALLALAATLGFVETALLPPLPIPGVRIGLANIGVLLAVAVLGLRWALAIAVGRVAIVGLLAGTLAGPSTALALAGALGAWCAYSLLARYGSPFSIVGWSVGGATAHVGAQYVVMSLLAGSPILIALAPYAVLASVISGLAVGFTSRSILSRLGAPLSFGVPRAGGVRVRGAATVR